MRRQWRERTKENIDVADKQDRQENKRRNEKYKETNSLQKRVKKWMKESEDIVKERTEVIVDVY